MATFEAATSSGEREYEALHRVIISFQRLVDDCEQAEDPHLARECLAMARDLYPSVRHLADQIRLTYGEVPSLRAGLARLDEALG